MVSNLAKDIGETQNVASQHPEVVAELSTLFELHPGDLVYTGTPAGVGAVRPGQTLEGYIEGLGTLTNRIV